MKYNILLDNDFMLPILQKFPVGEMQLNEIIVAAYEKGLNQPLELKEQVREEAPKIWECMDCNAHSFKKEIGGCPSCSSVHIQVMPEHKENYLAQEYKIIDELFDGKASNPELGVEKAAQKYADDICSVKNAYNFADKRGFIAGANWQATQQQGLVSLTDVTTKMWATVAALHHIADDRTKNQKQVDKINYAAEQITQLIKVIKTLKQ